MAHHYDIQQDDPRVDLTACPDVFGEIAERLTSIFIKNKMDTEAKKNRYEAQMIDRETFYRDTLQKEIQRFFRLKPTI